MTGAAKKVTPLRTPPAAGCLAGEASSGADCGRSGERAQGCPLGGEPGFVQELELKFQVRWRPLPQGTSAKKPAPVNESTVEIARQAGA